MEVWMPEMLLSHGESLVFDGGVEIAKGWHKLAVALTWEISRSLFLLLLSFYRNLPSILFLRRDIPEAKFSSPSKLFPTPLLWSHISLLYPPKLLSHFFFNLILLSIKIGFVITWEEICFPAKHFPNSSLMEMTMRKVWENPQHKKIWNNGHCEDSLPSNFFCVPG